MVRARVRVPARAHRRTNYCSHVDLSMTPKRVSQHVRINRKNTLQEMCPAHGDGETKMAPNLQEKTVRDMRKNPAHHQDPRIESRPAQKIAATICSIICICVCVWNHVKTVKTPGGGPLLLFCMSYFVWPVSYDLFRLSYFVWPVS